jgi:hypothetical protein
MAQTDPEVLRLMIELEEAVAAGNDELAEQIAKLIEQAASNGTIQNLAEVLAAASVLITAYFIEYSKQVRAGQVNIAKAIIDRDLDTVLPQLRKAGAPSAYIKQQQIKIEGYADRLEKTFYKRPNEEDGKTFDERIKTFRDDTTTTVRNIARQGLRNGQDARQIAQQVRAYLKPEYGGPASVSAYELQMQALGTTPKQGTSRIRKEKLPYAAKRIARSESGNTLRTAQVEMYEGTIFEEDLYDWLLSNTHRGPDACDRKARNSPYKASEKPGTHPNCVCSFVKRPITAEQLRARLLARGVIK